jgi:hypothetical protein
MSTADRSIRGWVATFAVAVVLATGCVAKEEPPELPSVGTLSSDIEVLNAAPAAAKNAPTEATAAPEDYRNFANAWLRVKVLQLYAAGIVLVPAIVMGAALQQEPTQDGDDWVWSVTAGEATADLEIQVGAGSGWDVELYVSNAEVEEFLWVDGNFATDLTEGEWRLHDHMLGEGSDEVLAIQWTYESETERALTYENRNETSADVGDTLSYAISGETARLTFIDASDPSLVAAIEWSTSTGAGSIEVPGYNGGDPACWDSEFVNADCP